MSREIVTVEERIETAKACAEGRLSQREAARRIGVDQSTVRAWVIRYKARGPLAFQAQEHKAVYCEEIKYTAVIDYLSGEGSIQKISAKYGLRSTFQLRSWIKVYNSGKDFSRKMSGGSSMKQGRETTQEERVAIAKTPGAIEMLILRSLRETGAIQRRWLCASALFL